MNIFLYYFVHVPRSIFSLVFSASTRQYISKLKPVRTKSWSKKNVRKIQIAAEILKNVILLLLFYRN